MHINELNNNYYVSKNGQFSLGARGTQESQAMQQSAVAFERRDESSASKSQDTKSYHKLTSIVDLQSCRTDFSIDQCFGMGMNMGPS